MTNTTTGNTKREKERDIASMNAVSLCRYKHKANGRRSTPPVCAIWERLLEPREGLSKNAAIRVHIRGLGGTSINGGKKDH